MQLIRNNFSLQKNRKVIPCYWETQPGGCLKPHCPFQHKTPKESGTEPVGEFSEASLPKTQENKDWNRRQGKDFIVFIIRHIFLLS